MYICTYIYIYVSVSQPKCSKPRGANDPADGELEQLKPEEPTSSRREPWGYGLFFRIFGGLGIRA